MLIITFLSMPIGIFQLFFITLGFIANTSNNESVDELEHNRDETMLDSNSGDNILGRKFILPCEDPFQYEDQELREWFKDAYPELRENAINHNKYVQSLKDRGIENVELLPPAILDIYKTLQDLFGPRGYTIDLQVRDFYANKEFIEAYMSPTIEGDIGDADEYHETFRSPIMINVVFAKADEHIVSSSELDASYVLGRAAGNYVDWGNEQKWGLEVILDEVYTDPGEKIELLNRLGNLGNGYGFRERKDVARGPRGIGYFSTVYYQTQEGDEVEVPWWTRHEESSDNSQNFDLF